MNEQWDVEGLHKRVYELEQEKDALKRRVEKVEQATEPMRVVLEQRPTEGETKLLETLLRQSGQQATDIGVLKQAVERIEASMQKRFDTIIERIELKMEKRFDAIAEVQRLILERLPEKE